ncbi:hypothetical protein SUGI_1035180 [Cryptomeria japonica]|nr:hypothetical protein SUGI_1035180 [Cryptomeria japonica]
MKPTRGEGRSILHPWLGLRKYDRMELVSRLIGPPIFEVSKLKVYTLTHSDITSKITLAISQTINNDQRFLHSMRGVQAAPIVASCLQIIVGFSGLWAIVARFLSPLSAVPLVTLVGLGLY